MKFIIVSIVTLSILSGLFISCSDNAIDIIKNETGSRVNTTIFGTVVKEDGIPISGAQVTVEEQVKTTGSNGQFIFENVSVPSDRLYIKSSFTGYFNASTSAKPNTDASTIVQIRMMEKDNIQTISGSTGGTVSLSNGSSVQIQPNSLELTNGTAYTGTVNVAIEYLDPTSQLFPLVLPGGDLSAKRSDSSNAILFSYGMLAVELTGSANEQLRIKSGQNSTLTISVPAGMVSGAPATIPLWYFDEASGIWREDGSATKQGSSYVGNVTHFTYWNCDTPGNRALLRGRIIDCNQNPLPNIIVNIGQVVAFTDLQGYFQRYVPSGIQFHVSVSSYYNNGLYTSQQILVGSFTAHETNINDMGNLFIDCPVQISTITGNVVCSGVPQNAYIIMRSYNEVYTAITFNGLFSVNVRPNTAYNVYIYKPNASFNLTKLSGNAGSMVPMGNIEACNTPSVAYDNGYVINGDVFQNDVVGFLTPNTYGYYNNNSTTGLAVNDDPDTSKIFSMSFKGYGIGIYSPTSMYVRLLGNDYNIDQQNPQGEVIVTGYGPVGGYITGTFSGTLIRNFTSIPVDISAGKFKVLRLE